MNGILLDTHVLLWWLADDAKLPRWMRQRIADPEALCFVSAATIWEIGIKRALGKLDAPSGLIPILAEEGFRHLHITLDHAQTAAALPLLHRDPFDRMLIGQALVESLAIATLDPAFVDYSAQLLAR